MGIIHIVYNDKLRTHIFYNGPLNDPSRIPDDLKRKEYSSLDGLLNCTRSALKLNPDKSIDVYIEGYTPEEETYIRSGLESKFRKIYFND